MLIYIYCHRENVQETLSRAAYNAVHILSFFLFLRREQLKCVFSDEKYEMIKS